MNDHHWQDLILIPAEFNIIYLFGGTLYNHWNTGTVCTEYTILEKEWQREREERENCPKGAQTRISIIIVIIIIIIINLEGKLDWRIQLEVEIE